MKSVDRKSKELEYSMKSTRNRMIGIALIVCLFAVGMAGLLNFFKYRSTAEQITRERLTVVGDIIESSIQQSLALGLNFSEINTLPETLKRLNDIDDLSLDIQVYDVQGHAMYRAEKDHPAHEMPAAWLAAAHRAGRENWFVDKGNESAAGIAIENNFGLTIGYIGIPYDSQLLRRTQNAVAWELGVQGALVFAVAATVASMAMIAVMRRLQRHVEAVEKVLDSAEPDRLSDDVRRGPLGRSLYGFFATVLAAQGLMVELKSHLDQGAKR